MKKMISILLSVILVIGLLTTAALATDEMLPGVYTTLEDGVLSGHIGVTFENYAFYPVSYTTGEAKTVYYWQPDVTSASIEEAPEGVTIVPKTDTNYSGLFVVSLPAGMSGNVNVSFRTSTGSGECILFSDGTDGGNQGGGEQGQTVPQHTLQPEEKLENGEEISTDPAAFTYDGSTYYLAPMTLIDSQSMTFRMGGGTSNPPSPVTAPWTYCLGIWSFTEGYGYELVDTDTRAEILAAFGDSLTMTMYAVNNEASENYPGYAANYPEMTPYNPGGWPCGATYIFTGETAGKWLFLAEGTINGQEVTAAATFRFEPRKVAVIDSPASVAELNEALADFAAKYPAESGYTCNVNLSDAELTGIITIPENLYLVCIYGAEGNTTLNGGMGVNSRTIIENIDFVGAGNTQEVAWERGWGHNWHDDWNTRYAPRWYSVWPEGTANAGQPNCGVFGKVNILYSNCSFRGYLYAFDNSECINFGGDNSLFENNAVAIYFNTTDGEPGNLGMTRNIFRNNGAAFWFEKLNPNYLPAEYSVIRCMFIDNGIDVVNRGERKFFLNGAYFAFNGEVGPVCGVSATEAGSVHSFPYACDTSFSSFDYSEDNAVVLNNQAGDWRIPETDLGGKTVTVLDERNDKVVGKWVFSE